MAHVLLSLSAVSGTRWRRAGGLVPTNTVPWYSGNGMNTTTPACATAGKQRWFAALVTIAGTAAVIGGSVAFDAATHAARAAQTLFGSFYPHVAWFASKSLENIRANAVEVLTAPVTFGDRLHWVNILGFSVCAAIAALVHYRGAVRVGFASLARFMFPPEFYRHPSALLDYQIYLANRVLTPMRPFTRALSDTAMAALVLSALDASFGPPLGRSLDGAWAMAVYTLLAVVSADFAGWAAHALMHRVPALWEFHKVHHSAEVLTPITYYRTHPAEDLVATVVSVLVSGTFSGVMAYVLLQQPSVLTLFGVNAVIAVFQVAGSNLRHSHIWLSWGSLLSHIVISPAQHQIHHSVDPRHFGKNYGSIFAVWDWMFGTLYVPKEKETLTFGLPGPEVHRTLAAAYIAPFRGASQVILSSLPMRRSRRVAAPLTARDRPSKAPCV